MNLKIGKVFTSKFVGSGPSSYKKKITGPRSHKVWETVLEQFREIIDHRNFNHCIISHTLSTTVFSVIDNIISLTTTGEVDDI